MGGRLQRGSCRGRFTTRTRLSTLLLSIAIVALTRRTAAAPFNLTICLHSWLDGSDHVITPELQAAIAAVEDVNRRGCELLGSNTPCSALPDGYGVKDVLVGVRGGDTGSAVRAAEECVALGADVVLGPAASEHTATVALVSQADDIPVVTYNSTSPRLTHEDGTRLLARTSFSDTLIANASVEFLTEVGLDEVAILHDCSETAHHMAESVLESCAEAGVKIHPFAICGSGVRLRDGLLRIKAARLRVVLVLGLSAETDAILREAESLQLLALDHRFLLADAYPSALLDEDTASLEARSLDIQQLRLAEKEAFKERLNNMTAYSIDDMLLLGGDGTQELVEPTLSARLSSMPSWAPLAAYDAVWGIALAGALVQTDDGSFGKMGSRMYAKLVSGEVSFVGASGAVGWEDNGDRATEGAAVEFSYVSNVGDGQLMYQTLAVWNISSGLQLRGLADPIIWTPFPDGEERSETCSCSACTAADCEADNNGSAFSGWSMAIGIVLGVVLSLALFLGSVMWSRYRKRRVTVQPSLSPTAQKKRSRVSLSRKKTCVTPSQSRSIEVLDLESPLAKMLQFLRRCEDSPLWSRPRGAEARALRELIEKSDDLLSPNLQHSLGIGLDGYSPYSEGVAQYLMHQTSVAPTPTGNRKMTTKTYSSSTMPSEEPSGAGDEGSGGTRHCEGDRRKLLEIPFVEIVDVDAHQFAVSSPKDVKVPIDSLNCIGLDFTLDFVTPDSMMRGCSEALVVVMKQAIAALELDNCLKTRQSILRLLSLARRLESGYMDGGYHNLFHAADVTNRLACVLRHSGISRTALRSSSQGCHLLAAIVAACAHDFEHPQVTNGFLVETEEPMAIAFNYQAVAENHSLRTSLALMSQAEYNFLEDWDVRQAKEFKRTVIRMVLATEMSRHFELLVQYKTKVVKSEAVKGKTGREAYAAMDDNQRMMTLQMAMKVADLGHCMLPIEQHTRWVEALQEEMFRQGDREKELHLDVSPMMDRDKAGVNHPDSQVGFFEVIVLPLIQLWVELFPGCSTLLDQTEANLEHWMDLQDQQRAIEAAQELEAGHGDPVSRPSRWTISGHVAKAVLRPLEGRRVSSAHKVVI